eukprot:6131567-Alexandrium_andersonii.AAC.1
MCIRDRRFGLRVTIGPLPPLPPLHKRSAVLINSAMFDGVACQPRQSSRSVPQPVVAKMPAKFQPRSFMFGGIEGGLDSEN